MATGQTQYVIGHFLKAAWRRDGEAMTDGQLLDAFIRERSEVAFAALVGRHAPMVLGVCRRVLRHQADAEDAFQATFLVLVRKAATVVPRELVGNWLYGTAYRAALETKARRGRERQVSAMPEPEAPPAEAWKELRPVLDQELARLPDKYRVPVVLCDLEGKSRAEAARQVGVAVGTLSGRLTTARRKLARLLARHGLTLSAGALAAALGGQDARAAVTIPLLRTTLRAAARLASGESAAIAGSAPVAAITEGVLKTMLLTKLRTSLVLLTVTATIGVGLTLLIAAGRTRLEGAWSKNPPAPTTQAGEKGKQPAPGASQEHLEQALRCAAEVKDPESKVRLLVLIARAQVRTGLRKDALRSLHQAFQIGKGLTNDEAKDFGIRCHLLSEVAEAQAAIGDFEAARKTAAALQRPKATANLDEQFVANGLALPLSRIAVALARAGKYKEATETVRPIDDKLTWFKGAQELVETAASQARAGEWDQAQKTIKAIPAEDNRVRAWIEVAKVQAKAGQRDAARGSLSEALRAVPADLPQDAVVQNTRANCLQLIALKQADIEDVKTAIVTAETIPELPALGMNGEILQFPYKQFTLALLQVRAGDYQAAAKVATAIDAKHGNGWQRGYALRYLARGQAEAKKIKQALVTADAIEHAFHKAAAFAEIAQAQAKSGDRTGAARTFEKARELADAVPVEPDDTNPDRESLRPRLLLWLAAAQAVSGEVKSAQGWIRNLNSATLRAWALVGLSEGIAGWQQPDELSSF
jgi:RNA polymerase sigma factor (sigma-70 family)